MPMVAKRGVRRPTAAKAKAKAIRATPASRVGKANPEATAPEIPATVHDAQVIVHGAPPAWAETRPDLCDALPWFRAVQGGSYNRDGFCWGFLLDADCGDRSYIDDEIVITRIGGGCTKDSEGNLVLLKDQDGDTNMVSSIINSKEFNVPVGLIIGDRNTVLGRKLPHRYNVMAYFRVTDVWYEKVGKRTGAKVRFEKLDLECLSWWAMPGSPPPEPLSKRQCGTTPETIQCSACMKTSRRVYNEGWMCLQPSCKNFWTMEGSHPNSLTFYSGFLSFRMVTEPTMLPQYSLVPNLLATIDEDDTDVSTIRIAWKGIVCPQCNKCIARRFWKGWKCTDDIACVQGESCTFQKTMKMHPVSLRSVIDDFELGPIKRCLFFDPKFARPEIDDRSLYPYRKLTYRIPEVGSITHFVSNRDINSRENGPNDLFKQLQLTDLGLRRYPLQQSVVAGTLTAHFAVNYGMPYKYIVSVDSKGFDEAADEILRALGRLTWATDKAVTGSGDEFLPPNELLTLGYFDEMKIGYHDDGESSLGPTISTLSLGAKATMLIRMKYKYFNGCSKAKKLLDDDPVLPGCQLEDQRRELKRQLNRGAITRKEYERRRQEGSKKCRATEASPFIKMELHHGDLVVMHGENLQKYYEHSVIPEKKLRFALTARYIKPDQVDKSEWKKGEFSLTPDQIYDGK
ncbi:hypothetical protein PHISCL_00813 [Aspergillus sclerotialis]|uniref:Alpha-ketoglutarate-dependent dioxygenase AlkB-like domain-containing protein n=1 Tax=Aspergillus sclerotialis TaxID=2070753 RepID=A0A3A3AC53_9EURO|nr:hypothetical protein PHISCL_00813 [Aspergillus sclerotialis]